MNNVTLRRRADEVKRITRDESDGRSTAGLQHSDVGGSDDLDFVYDVSLDVSCGGQLHGVARCYVLESAEETITMTGNPDVARRSWIRRADDVPNTAIENRFGGAFENRNAQLEFWNRKHCDRITEFNLESFSIFVDSFLGPEAEVAGLIG